MAMPVSASKVHVQCLRLCDGHQHELRALLCAAGTEAQKLLVATMRRLTPAVMMMAINHKGRIIYANTQLANMLGYKLKALK